MSILVQTAIVHFGDSELPHDLRRSMVFLDVHWLNKPEVMIASAHERFDEEGRLTDEDTKAHINKMVVALGEWTRLLQAGKQFQAGDK